jgi:hypothetical protein
MRPIKHIGLFCLLLILLPEFVSGKEKVISLKKETIEFPLTGYSIEEIINVTKDDNYIGFELSNANFQKYPVRFEKSISEEFSSLLSRFPSGEPKQKILIRVNWIFLYEVQLEEQKLTTTELNLSFIEKNDSGFVELYRGAVSVQNHRNQKLNILDAIDSCLQGFTRRATENKLCRKEQPIEKLIINPLDHEDIESFVNIDRTHRGIYWTYDDFFYNTPDTVSLFSVKYKDKFNKQDSLIIKHAKAYFIGKTMKSLDAWGFVENGRVFTKAGDLYYLLNPYCDGYYLKFNAHDNTGFSVGAAIGGMIFGLAGGLFVGVMVGLIPGANSSEQLLHFDLNSGSFDVFFEKGQKVIESKLIFYSPPENEHNFELFINDKFKCTLQTDTWFEMTFLPSVKSLNVKLKSEDGSIFQSEISPKLLYTDVYVCHERKNKPPFFRKVSYNTTESTLEKLVDEKRIK